MFETCPSYPSVEVLHHGVIGVLVGHEEGSLDVAAVRVLQKRKGSTKNSNLIDFDYVLSRSWPGAKLF